MTIIAAEQYNGLCHISISPISYGQTVWLFAQQDKKRIKKTRQKRAKQRKKKERKRKIIKEKKNQPPLAYGQTAWPSAAAAPNDFPPRKKNKEKKTKNKEPEQPPLAYGQTAWPSAAAAPDEFPPMSCPALSCYTPVRMYEGHIRDI